MSKADPAALKKLAEQVLLATREQSLIKQDRSDN
jgi:hypothetical protein